MKKNYLIILVIVLFTLCGCSNKSKEVKGIGEFNEISVNNDFKVVDNMNSYENIDYIDYATLAVIDDDSNLEMVIYESVDYAKEVQEGQIENFASRKSTGATENKDKGKNYYKYSLISNNRYMVSSRVENTLIFCNTSLSNKSNVDAILEELEY